VIVARPVIGSVRLAGSVILIAGLFVGCGPRPAIVTVQSLDATRTRWEARPVRSYHIIVDIERPGDRRRNDITVLDEMMIRSSVAYWDERRRDWGPSRALTAGQATPFTVPGLFALIRRNSSRVIVRTAGWPSWAIRPSLSASCWDW
jgi:hypothetical protein